MISGFAENRSLVSRTSEREARALIRDPGYFYNEESWVPGLQRITSCCAAPGTRVAKPCYIASIKSDRS